MLAVNRFQTYASVAALARMGQATSRMDANPDQAGALQEKVVDILGRRGCDILPDLLSDVQAEKWGQAHEVSLGLKADYGPIEALRNLG